MKEGNLMTKKELGANRVGREAEKGEGISIRKKRGASLLAQKRKSSREGKETAQGIRKSKTWGFRKRKRD